MDATIWLVLASAVFIGSYVQSVVGFAIGMVVMAVGGASGVVSLPVLTAVVSIISFVNIVVALRGHLHFVDRRNLGRLVAGQLPAVFAGVALITVLDRDARWVLELLLGIFIVAGSVSMVIRPISLAKVSSGRAWIAAGAAGGLMGGMFSASGPVIGWFMYRQPLALVVSRATMLVFFGLATLLRTVIVAAQGGLTLEVWRLSLIATPLVILGAYLGRIAPPRLSEAALKRAVFVLLLLIGVYIICRALLISAA